MNMVDAGGLLVLSQQPKNKNNKLALSGLFSESYIHIYVEIIIIIIIIINYNCIPYQNRAWT